MTVTQRWLVGNGQVACGVWACACGAGKSVSGVTVMESDQNRSSWGLSAVCLWINTLPSSCSVSHLIGAGIYYCCLIALQPAGTRRSASGRLCTCALDMSDRAATQTTHTSLEAASQLFPHSQQLRAITASRIH